MIGRAALWMSVSAAHVVSRLLAEKTRIRGFRVFSLSDSQEATRHFEQVEEALDLVSRTDPIRYRRLTDAFSTIFIAPMPPGVSASADPPRRFCQVSRQYLDEETTDGVELASTLIHEATHAHVEAAGVRFREAVRPRIERVCISAEIAFLRQLPRWPADTARRSFAKFQFLDSHYTDAGLALSRRRGIEDLGLPPWATTALTRAFDRLQRGRNGT